MNNDFIIDIPIYKPGEVMKSGTTYNPECYQSMLNDDKNVKSLITEKRLVLIKELTPEILAKEKEFDQLFQECLQTEFFSTNVKSEVEKLVSLVNQNAIGIVLEWNIGSIKVQCNNEEIYNYIKEIITDDSYKAKHMVIITGSPIKINNIENKLIVYLFGFTLF